VPINGSTAVPATLQSLSNTMKTSLQCQPEAYGDIGPCSMECKYFSNSDLLSNLSTYIMDDFNDLNCTLVLRSLNTTDNSSYVIQILELTNLIFLSNSSTSSSQFLCNSNTSSTINTPMMCRFIYRQQSFNNTPCSSTAVTTRDIPPGTGLLHL
jgi:hypothetical protein